MATVPLGGFSELEARYKQQLHLYDTYIKDALQSNSVRSDTLDKIKQTNQAIAKTLDDMIGLITQSKQTDGNIHVYRDELVAKLQRIQKDYNGLLQNTDTLETLRRIRNQEEKEATGTLFWLIVGFLIVCILVLILMIVFGQKKVNADIMPTSPATTTALM